MSSIANCHMCGNQTDPEYICTSCDEVVCEDCMVKMTIHNQIDYCLCENCYSGSQAREALYYSKLEDEKIAADKLKKEKSFKRWQKYHSAEQIEKRRLKRVALLKLRQERAAKRAEYFASVLSDLFKNM